MLGENTVLWSDTVFVDGELLVPKPVGMIRRWRVERLLSKHGRDVDIRWRLQKMDLRPSATIYAVLCKIMRTFPVVLVTDDVLHTRVLGAVRDCMGWSEPPRLTYVTSMAELRDRMTEQRCAVCFSNLFSAEASLGATAVYRYADEEQFVDMIGKEVVR